MQQRSLVPMVTTSSAAASPSSPRYFEIIRRTMLSLVLLVVLIGTVIAVVWMIMNPRPPAFRLDSLSISGLPNASDVSSPTPELHVQIQLTATNPNRKLGLVIRGVDLWLALGHHKRRLRLSSHKDTSSSAYYIGKRGHQVLTFNMKAVPRRGHGTRKRLFPFAVAVGMEARIMFTHQYWPSKRASVKVECKNRSVGPSSSGRIGELKDGGKDCSVDFD